MTEPVPYRVAYSQRVRDDLHRRGERVVSERVIAVVVRVDEVFERLVGEPGNERLQLSRDRSVDAGVDQKGCVGPDDQPRVVARHRVRHQRVYPRSKRPRPEANRRRLEIGSYVSKRPFVHFHRSALPWCAQTTYPIATVRASLVPRERSSRRLSA